jgi:uncharacterized membrane protein YcaP (DUF421 family)
MEFLDRLGASWQTIGVLVVSATAVYAAVILLTRLSGARSLAKMSSFDFAATVAIGSTVSSVTIGTAPLLSGVVVLAMLYGLQYAVARVRRAGLLQGALDNSSLVLVADGRLLTGNLDHAGVSDAELWSQLRLHGVQRLEQVRAVVLETTGDMSVLTGDGGIDEELLLGVRDGDRLRSRA